MALAAPLAGAATDSTGCFVRTTQAIEFAPYYMVGTAAEFWEETNGIAGLQRSDSGCIGRPALPADTCITRTENTALVSCSAEFLASLAP